MAVASAVEIALSQEERSERERRACKLMLPHRDVQRAKVVLYAAEGMSNVEIAGRLEMCSKVVGQWRRRLGEQRLEGLQDHRGRVARGAIPAGVAHVKAIACEPPETHGVALALRPV